jgi:hypothetical protein
MNNRKELYHVDIDPFNSPLGNYIRFRKRLQKYEDLKQQSTVRYYGHVGKKLVVRYIKRDMLSSLVNMMLMMFAYHFAEQSGFIEYMLDKKDALYEKIYRIYKFLFGLN